jgi:hypothetical protein
MALRIATTANPYSMEEAASFLQYCLSEADCPVRGEDIVSKYLTTEVCQPGVYDAILAEWSAND